MLNIFNFNVMAPRENNFPNAELIIEWANVMKIDNSEFSLQQRARDSREREREHVQETTLYETTDETPLRIPVHFRS